MPEVTPMMKQYLEVKERCPDSILFFRLGDFYEMFFEDAKIASRELELVLTGKDCGLEERAPMCGIPYHAALSYISRLIGKGYKVSVCEQLEDPALAKGIVKRDIVKIYTPGTVTEEQMLSQNVNNYIVCVYDRKDMYGIAAADISTGIMYVSSFTMGSTYNHLANEIARYAPSELILNSSAGVQERISNLMNAISNGAYISRLPDSCFEYKKAADTLDRVTQKKNKQMPGSEYAIAACGALVDYIEETQKNDITGKFKLEFYESDEYLSIDASSRRNLEITETLRDRSKKGSLLWVLDRTCTSMGSRKLRNWIKQPLIDTANINERLDAVEELKDCFMLRSQLRDLLSGIYDIERLTGKLDLENVNARDLVSLRTSLAKIPAIKETMKDVKSDILKEICADMDTLEDVRNLLDISINDDPPMIIKDGGIIKEGYSSEADELRNAQVNGKSFLAGLEAREREKTGIKNLKVSYNKVFGYYIEVTKSYIEQVPSYYIRKQTLVNNERYITDELKKMEDTILGAQDRLIALELTLFQNIRETAAKSSQRLKITADCLSKLDALCSYAEIADRENYNRPVVDNSDIIDIKDARHPVVEKMLTDESFVPNDVYIDRTKDMLLVITGPNMAGKSTYMRMTALVILMAQSGCFVPASSARIGIVDKLFTRVGASDDLASGQSTFMVEMTEVANILSNATEKSFLILDEIGRGTSTFDGLSIAWSVLEYIVNKIKCKAMFATHYHELTEIESRIEGVRNYCVTVNRKKDDIVFLRKIKRGMADGSYGICVASLAGIPKAVTLRAEEILEELDKQSIGGGKKKKSSMPRVNTSSFDGSGSELDLLSYAVNTVMHDEIIEELKSLKIQEMTPIEAMNVLYKLYQKAEKRI